MVASVSRRAALMSLLLAGALAGCSSPAPKDETKPVTIDVTIANGQITPAGSKIDVYGGSEVTITITSDRNDTLHVHGYEIEIPVVKGQKATKTFTADKLGRYEIETHSPATIVAFLDVR